MAKITLSIAVLTLVLMPAAAGQQIYTFYNRGDWVSYTNTRYVTAIARGFNTIYFGTTDGILRYDKTTEKWLDPLTISNGMPENHIRKMVVDRLTDEIWIETPNHTAYYSVGFEEWYLNEPFPDNRPQPDGISPARFPQMFVSPGYHYLPGGSLLGHNLLEYPITETLLDDAEVVWVGAWGLGAGRADLRRASLELLPFGPYDSDIGAFTIDGDDFWFTGGGDGMPGAISHYDRREDSWEYFEPREHLRINSDQFYVVKHDARNIWLGTELGLVRYDRKRKGFTSYTHFDGIYGERVTALLPTRGNVIIGTDIGVSVFDLKRDTIYSATEDNLRGRIVLDLELGGKTIYAATDYGIYTLLWGGSFWQRCLESEPVVHGVVFDIQIVDSLLYAVSDDGVVVVNLNSNDYVLHDRNTRFNNADLRVLLVHEDVVWAGGADGLFRLNKKTGNWYQYTPADGLISYHVTSLAADGQHIWIGTDKGVTRFLWQAQWRPDNRE